MRTTVTLDHDLFSRLQELSHQTRKPFKAVLNETIRRGLGVAEIQPGEAFRVIPHPCRLRPGIDEGRLNQLVDELDIEATAEKLREGR